VESGDGESELSNAAEEEEESGYEKLKIKLEVLAPATTVGSGVHTEERVRAVGCLVIVGRGWEFGKVRRRR